MGQSAKNIIFIGRVQGIGFRFTAFDVANRYNLTGMVRNLPNGTVEMLTQGRPDDIDDCIRDIQASFAGYIRETKVEEIPNDFKITF